MTDLVLNIDATKVVLEIDEQRIVLAGPAGTLGGESNTIADAGQNAHESLVATPAKVGLALQVKGLRAGAGITLTDNPTDEVVEISQSTGTAGDVVGPAGAGDNVAAVFDGTTGKLLKEPSAPVDMNAQAITNVGNVDGRDVSADGAKLDTIETSAKDDQTITAGAGLTGGGTGDVSLAADFGTGAGKVTEGNDSRLSDDRNPTPHAIGGSRHTASTLAALNAKVSDATLDDSSASRPPTGAAGGDLTGTYPSPTIAPNAVTDVEVATGNKDGLAATPSMRTLGTGAQQAAAGNDPRILTQAENDAALGTSGSPSGANRYVTDADPRNSDARTPTAHASSHSDGGSDEITAQNLGSGAAAAGQILSADGVGGWSLAAAPSSLTASAPVNVDKSAAAVGIATDAARADHKHDIDTAAPGGVTVGALAAEGSSSSLARADHVHAVTAPAAPANVTKAAASAGASTSPARADHKHDASTGPASGLDSSTVNSEGSSANLARADHGHEISETGSLAQINAGDTPADGSAAGFSRKDHQHGVATAAPSQGIGAGNTEGISTNLARADHDHTIRTGATDLTVGAIADGQNLRRSGTTIVGITPTDSDENVKVSGADTTAGKLTDKLVTNASIAKTILNPTLDEDLQLSVVFGTAAGTSTEGDDSRVPTQSENDALQGTSGVPSGSNRYVTDADSRNTNARTPTSHASSHSDGGSDEITAQDLGSGAATAGQILSADGLGGWSLAAAPAGLTASAPADVTKAAAAVGVATDAARADHKHDVATAAASALTLASTASEGSATSLARSDHGHSIAASTAPANVTKSAAAIGTSNDVARADHKHDVTTAAPSTIGSANSEGTATSLARSDHVHDHGAQAGGSTHALAVASGAAGFMSGADKAKLDSAPSGGFGADYQSAVSSAVSATTLTTPQTKVSLTTPALTGTYLVQAFWSMSATIKAKEGHWRLQNTTDAVGYGEASPFNPSPLTNNGFMTGAAAGVVTFTGAAKTFAIQWWSVGGDEVNVKQAKILFWRLSA